MSSSVGIIFIGRGNRAKRSDALARVASELAGDGFDVQSFTSDSIRASERINERLARVLPAIEASRDRDHPLHLRLLRILLKGIMVLNAKERWELIGALFRPKPLTAAMELDRFVSRSPLRMIHLITHSSGGIAATKVSENPKIGSICCFGYPFQRPAHPPESYRTQHLTKVTKPLIIIQGTRDEYGPPSSRLKAILPAQAQIFAVDSDHDYADVSPDEFEAILAAIRTHLTRPPCEAPA